MIGMIFVKNVHVGRNKFYMNNINNFMNGFEQFKKYVDTIPDKQLIKECEILGMKFEQKIPKYLKSTRKQHLKK